MVDGETIETKISDKKDEFEEKTDEKKEDMKDKYEETKEKGKTIADNVISDLSRSIDEFKENLKNMQKAADKKYADYKKTTVQSLDVDLVETEDVYYVKASVPGIDKEGSWRQRHQYWSYIRPIYRRIWRRWSWTYCQLLKIRKMR